VNECKPLLCGWWQAKDEHVKVYSNTLQKLGCGTLRGTMEPHLLAGGRRGARLEHAARMLAILNEAITRSNMHGHPLYFMFFSSGGAYVWAGAYTCPLLSST
jgi:hypothetical protein